MAPLLQGVIRRRILLNYRVDPAAARTLVPDFFELTLADGWAIAGVCLIRLEGLRPPWLPGPVGLSSESAAYRVAVSGPDGSAVYVPRRDTDSALQAAAGGRFFPARFGRIRVDTRDDGSRIGLRVSSNDGLGDVRIVARRTDANPKTSVFADLESASRFFERGSVGWSPRPDEPRYDQVELRLREWRVEALAVDRAESAFYDDGHRFPPGSIEFDSALIMRDVPHEWRAPSTATGVSFGARLPAG